MRNWLALSLSAVLALSLLSGCDDHDKKTPAKTVHYSAASSVSRLGVGWKLTADGKLSAWSFASPAEPAPPGAPPPGAFEGIRTALAAKMLPPRDSVRIADLISRAILAAPPGGDFHTTQDMAEQSEAIVTTTPWNDHTWLLWVAVNGLEPAGTTISVEFDPKIIAAFRPLGDVTLLPDPRANAGRAEMLYELSPQPNEAQPGHAVYAMLHISRTGPDNAPPRRFDRPVTDTDFIDSIDNAPDRVRFATAVAGFGGLLRGDPAVRDLSCADVIAMAESAGQPDPDGARAQMVVLMHEAEPLIDQPADDTPQANEQAR